MQAPARHLCESHEAYHTERDSESSAPGTCNQLLAVLEWLTKGTPYLMQLSNTVAADVQYYASAGTEVGMTLFEVCKGQQAKRKRKCTTPTHLMRSLYSVLQAARLRRCRLLRCRSTLRR